MVAAGLEVESSTPVKIEAEVVVGVAVVNSSTPVRIERDVVVVLEELDVEVGVEALVVLLEDEVEEAEVLVVELVFVDVVEAEVELDVLVGLVDVLVVLLLMLLRLVVVTVEKVVFDETEDVAEAEEVVEVTVLLPWLGTDTVTYAVTVTVAVGAHAADGLLVDSGYQLCQPLPLTIVVVTTVVGTA